MSKTDIFARMRPDGTLVEVLGDGTERPFPDTPTRPMTPEEIEKAAWADPDARPMTEEEFARAKRVPRARTLRRALGLTLEEFAVRYRIPLGTLRDWEQGRSEPDQPARAYLIVIAHDPEGVRVALDRHAHQSECSTLMQGGETPGVSDAQWGEFLRTVRLNWVKNAADPRVRIAQLNDPYDCAAHFAYLDVCRTFHGIRENAVSFQIDGRKLVSEKLRAIAGDPSSGPIEFDLRHRDICQHLIDELQKRASSQIFLGQVQKWMNMAIKYGFAFGKKVIPGLAMSWYYAHIPIDSYIRKSIDELRNQRLSAALRKALGGQGWSRISNYDHYLDFQKEVRKMTPQAPLKLEFEWWLAERNLRSK